MGKYSGWIVITRNRKNDDDSCIDFIGHQADKEEVKSREMAWMMHNDEVAEGEIFAAAYF